MSKNAVFRNVASIVLQTGSNILEEPVAAIF
jgi:hypothetical protein